VTLITRYGASKVCSFSWLTRSCFWSFFISSTLPDFLPSLSKPPFFILLSRCIFCLSRFRTAVVHEVPKSSLSLQPSSSPNDREERRILLINMNRSLNEARRSHLHDSSYFHRHSVPFHILRSAFSIFYSLFHFSEIRTRSAWGVSIEFQSWRWKSLFLSFLGYCISVLPLDAPFHLFRVPGSTHYSLSNHVLFYSSGIVDNILVLTLPFFRFRLMLTSQDTFASCKSRSIQLLGSATPCMASKCLFLFR